MNSAIGTFIGRYQIDAEIGRGAMGLVYQAHDPRIDRLVAIKTISLMSQEIEDEQEFRERFFLEAKAAGRLSHPGIVTIFDVGEESETHEPYIVMEFVAGQPLNRILAGQGRKLPLGPALQITQEVAEALHYAHSQGVVHRDIKPANILVTLEGRPKIADFGVAKLNQGLMTIPGQVLGSPAYMAPEQLNGESADARSDLFSLGVILYSMLTGFRPFQGNSAATVSYKVMNRDPLPVTSFDSDFPLELDRVVSRAIAKDPAQRFQSGSEMAQEIQRIRERHNLLEQTAGTLACVAAPDEGTGVVRVPSSRPVSQPGSHGSSSTRAKTTARTTGSRREAAPSVAPPPPRATPKPQAFDWKKIRNISFTGISLGAIPKEIVFAGVTVLALAVAVISLEALHSKKHKPTIEATKAAAPASIAPAAATPAAQMDKLAALYNPDITPTDSEPQATPAEVRPKPVKAAKTRTKSSAGNHSTTQAKLKPIPTNPSLASLQNAKATMPVAPATSTLQIQIQYQFEQAEASVWLDNQLIYSQKLFGESKKRALLFKKVEGKESSTVKIPAGEHRLHVRILSAAEQYDQSQSIAGNFSASAKSVLGIICDKHSNQLQLTLQ